MDNYYYIKFNEQSYFVCPTCKSASICSYNDFYETHKNHLGLFTSCSKKSILLSTLNNKCPTYINNICVNDTDYASVEKCHDAMKKYFTYTYYGQDYYICPGCMAVEQSLSYKQFYDSHSVHLQAFTKKSKRRIFMDNKPGTSSSIGAVSTTPGPSSSAAVAKPTGKRKFQHESSEDNLIIKRSMNGNYVSLQFNVEDIGLDKIEVNNTLRQRLETEINRFEHCKVQFGACVLFENLDGELKTWCLSDKAKEYNDTFLSDISEKLNEKIQNYSELGSGWRVKNILQLSFIITKYLPLIYLSGHSYMKTPSILYHSKSIVNVQNKDNLCFLYSILSVVHYNDITRHNYRPSQYKTYLNELKYDIGQMPMKLKDIGKFETENNLSITIFKYNNDATIEEDEIIYKNPHVDIVYRTKNPNARSVPLLILEERDKYHYVGIVDLDRLLNIHDRQRGIYIHCKWCISCLHGFRSQIAFDRHVPLCKANLDKTTLYVMPKNKCLKFTDYSKTVTPGYVVYADIEALLIPNGDGNETKHLPIAAGSLIVPLKAQAATDYQYFVGDDCLVRFLQYIEEFVLSTVVPFYKNNAHTPMVPLSSVQQSDFNQSTRCYLCDHDDGQPLVRDHDHVTGHYLGAACKSCNLSRQIRPQLPIVFHNFRGYDSHHIIKHALSKFKHWSLSVVPQSTEKFLAIFAHLHGVTLRFMDSYQFLSDSLARLSSFLDCFPLTSTAFPQNSIHKKGIFPYTFATSLEILQTTTSLPPKWAGITDVEYNEAHDAWNSAGCQSLLDYMLYYLRLDVYLLADIFQAFRIKALQEDGLEPLCFLSIPGMSWSSALKTLSEPLDLLLDSEMYRFFSLSIRGGMTFVNTHYTKSDDDTSLLYIDINNLYGWALSQPLPCSNFSWILGDGLEQMCMDLLRLDTVTSEYGYTMEVDLVIPDEHHDKLDQLPLAPELKCPPNSKIKKLLLTHTPKFNYIVHWRLLQCFVNLGAQVVKVHRMIKYRQANVFANYINFNSQRRASSTSKFDKDFYKLKNNSLYGKTVENLLNRLNIRLCNNEKQFLTYTSHYGFRRSMHIAESLVAILLNRNTVCLDRPIYIGHTVLDLSKLRMYELQYKELESYRNHFNCHIDIIAGDTDSFFLRCRNVNKLDLLTKMHQDGLLDTSNYAPDHILYSSTFANQIGLFKDEGHGDEFDEAVFLNTKCYSLHRPGSGQMRAKGVILKQTSINHDNYLAVYNDGMPLNVNQTTFQTVNHQIFTVKRTKRALTVFENKRFWTSRNTSLAYGHWRINNNNNYLL